MTETETLTFSSVTLGVRTDVPEVADYCRRLFARLVDPAGRPSRTLELMTHGEGRWHVKDEVIDATLDHADWLPGIVCARVLETFGNAVEDHDLFHGAALSRNGNGLVLCGESGFGKSTLTLALLARGWNFLSDEVAAIHRRKPVLTPFLKALELLPQSGERVGIDIGGQPEKRGKILRDPESLFPGCGGVPCPVRAVVFLDAPEGSKVAGVADETLRVVVHRRDDRVIREMIGVEGVHGVAWSGETDGCPAIEIRRDPAVFPAWRLDEILGRCGLLIVDSSAEEQPPTDFSGEPSLEPMATPAGVGRLLVCFRGRRAFARRLDECGGDFSALFLSFIERLRGVRFFTLRVGRLDAEVERLEAALE